MHVLLHKNQANSRSHLQISLAPACEKNFSKHFGVKMRGFQDFGLPVAKSTRKKYCANKHKSDRSYHNLARLEKTTRDLRDLGFLKKRSKYVFLLVFLKLFGLCYPLVRFENVLRLGSAPSDFSFLSRLIKSDLDLSS